VASRSIANQHMAHELQAAGQQVREGRALAAAMNASGAFPDVAIKMVEVGESTGALQEMLNSLSDFYDEEIETSLGRFVTMVEPVLLVVMGIVIAGLLLALYMPLFKLSSALS
jgi:type IV pilus assembly protein PilC